MKKQFFLIIIVSNFLYCCTFSDKKTDTGGVPVELGDIETYRSSEIIADYSFIKLETSGDILIGDISQIEIKDDKIYILDTHKARSLFIFSLDGKFLNSIKGTGNGPGEFMVPFYFQIDDEGYIYIYDMYQQRLQKYNQDDLSFIEQIDLPARSPLSFFKTPGEDEFIYYCVPNAGTDMFDKQLIVADKSGNTKYELWDTPVTSKLNHGYPGNIYYFNNKVHFYPYFSNQIFTIEEDSLQCKYELYWGKNKMVDDIVFRTYEGSNNIFQAIMNGEEYWIRMMYVYESQKYLMVKYYIKSDFYVGVYNKQNGSVIHYRQKDVNDDIGLGGVHPLPVGMCNDRYIGFISPQEMDESMVKDAKLKNVLHENFDTNDNPVLMLYNLNNIE
ncbi:MAG: 6-bladed beta-propeller [Bacteroidales bacterium]|nr:6-bladed beta-propeller [Bacteroidales bacterium]